MAFSYYFAITNNFLNEETDKQKRFIVAAAIATLSLILLISGYGLVFIIFCAVAVIVAKANRNLLPRLRLSNISG